MPTPLDQGVTHPEEPKAGDLPDRLFDSTELRRRFVVLTHLLYDTSVPLGVLERDVVPLLAPDIEFVDPWVHIHGARTFRTGLRGFHCLFRFDFTIHQAEIQLDPVTLRGRAIVDGVMNLKQLYVYTYPLRTTLVYDFRLAPGGGSFVVTRLDEMWSLGDLVANVPVVGIAYDIGRHAWGAFFSVAFPAACAVLTRLRPSLLRAREFWVEREPATEPGRPSPKNTPGEADSC